MTGQRDLDDGVTVIVNKNEPRPPDGKSKTERFGSYVYPALGRVRHGFFSIRWITLLIALGWEVIGVGFLSLIYQLVTSQGLAELAPSVFGQRMSRLPGFAWMAQYHGWHRLTVGHVAAAGLMIFVAVSWFLLVRDLLLVGGNRLDERKWKVRNARWFWRIAGIGLLAADGILFFRGLVEMNSWSSTSSQFSALVLTVFYGGALMVFSFVSVLLWSQVRRNES